MSIKERILRDLPSYKSGGEYKDLIAFYLCGEHLLTDDEETWELDFNYALVVVEKDWLFNYMGEPNPIEYLREEYNSEDSLNWYAQALLDEKIVAINFDC